MKKLTKLRLNRETLMIFQDRESKTVRGGDDPKTAGCGVDYTRVSVCVCAVTEGPDCGTFGCPPITS
jgi:hypothetical protein